MLCTGSHWLCVSERSALCREGACHSTLARVVRLLCSGPRDDPARPDTMLTWQNSDVIPGATSVVRLWLSDAATAANSSRIRHVGDVLVPAAAEPGPAVVENSVTAHLKVGDRV